MKKSFILLLCLFITYCKQKEVENLLQPELLVETTLRVQSRYIGIYQDKSIKGSGLLLDSMGRIITVYHVVQEIYPAKLNISSDGKQFFSAKLLFFDKTKDLAILSSDLKIPIEEPEIELQSNLRQGQPIFLIGAPYELHGSFLKGFISFPKREQLDMTYPEVPFIQTYGTSFPGCSGSGVFLYNGKLIGLNRATYGNSYGNSIGLVIPASIVIEFKEKFFQTLNEKK